MSRNDDRRRFDSFSELFRERQMPIGNRDFVVHAFDGIDIIEMVETASYVKMIRADGERDLHLYNSIIGGYQSEEEALKLTGAKIASPSKSRPGTWWVHLPVHGDPQPGYVQRNLHGGKKDRPAWIRIECSTCGYLMNEHQVCTFCP